MKTAKLVAPALVIVLAACSNSNMGTVSFSLTSRPSAALAGGASAPGVAAAGDSTVITLGSDSIIVRSAQLVLRKVELKRIDVASCDSVVASSGCEEFETGSKLITLPLGSAIIAQDVAITVPAGTFNEFELEVHKPTSSSDSAFVAANPTFANISIRVTGTYSQAGTRSAFTFTSDIDQSEKASLNPPVTVADGGTLNVTLRVNLSGWFLNAAKTALVDPASANNGQPNQSVVANNIQNSFQAFEDDNHDGQPDH